MRRFRPIALLGLLSVTAALAFPGEGSALSAVFITLTSNGPSPADMTILAGQYPLWHNSDTTTHSVAFANGLCSFQLAPGASGECPAGFENAGSYPYTVDGTIQAGLVVTATAPDTVTLTAGGHSLRRGASLRLHGTLAAYECCLPPPSSVGLHVVVFARHDRHHPFRRLARGAPGRDSVAGFHYPWSLHVRPRATTIYIARVRYVRGGVQGPQVAWSRPFKVRVRPARR